MPATWASRTSATSAEKVMLRLSASQCRAARVATLALLFMTCGLGVFRSETPFRYPRRGMNRSPLGLTPGELAERVVQRRHVAHPEGFGHILWSNHHLATFFFLFGSLYLIGVFRKCVCLCRGQFCGVFAVHANASAISMVRLVGRSSFMRGLCPLLPRSFREREGVECIQVELWAVE